MTSLLSEPGGLQCLCAFTPGSLRVAYILYPMDILVKWAEEASERYGTDIVVITGMDWDDDLTPWPAKGVPSGSPDFKGEAEAFLGRLERLVEDVERHIEPAPGARRSLVGVSLSGLFTLWQWPQTSLFHDVASLSGSFWYEGFADWFERQNLSAKGVAYFLLGNKEASASVKAFQSVARDTQRVIGRLRELGIATEFESVPGNHYQYPIERLDRAMTALKAHSASV